MRRMSPLERNDVVNEIRLLASIQHANICRYYEAFMDGDYLCIVMEFAVNGAVLLAADPATRGTYTRALTCVPFRGVESFAPMDSRVHKSCSMQLQVTWRASSGRVRRPRRCATD